jgi:hypothetical protein
LENKTRGIVIRTIKYGESSAICNILTEQFGLIGFHIPGVYKNKGKVKISYLQPLNTVEVSLNYKKNSNLQRILDITCHSYPELKSFRIQIIQETDPLKVLKMLASTKYLVLANSTFSFWSYYFGNHLRIYAPKPFYIKQYMWGNKLWSREEIKMNKINLQSYTIFIAIWYISVRSINTFKYFLKKLI